MAERQNKKSRVGLVFGIIGCVLGALVMAFFVYVNIYYRASDDARKAALTDTAAYKTELNGDGSITFAPDGAEVGLIFYPGGKVEHAAYAPLMAELAKRGVLCVLVKMPFNLAVLDINAADGIREHYPAIKDWYMGGHSLGGTIAAKYAAGRADSFKGLLLLGAYSTDDISGTALKVVSIYGSEDGVLNKNKYSDNRSNLPSTAVEYVIEGGNHAYFGDYGEQRGDGRAAITPSAQQSETADKFVQAIA